MVAVHERVIAKLLDGSFVRHIEKRVDFNARKAATEVLQEADLAAIETRTMAKVEQCANQVTDWVRQEFATM